ncbi:MAG: hypothetical protein AAFO77_04400 [Pseudomonadota bacterium]
MKIDVVGQFVFAGAMVGFLIGPDSLDQFIGMFPEHTIVTNVIAGAIIGTGFGVIASFFQKSENAENT